jgi:hypothetical protein
MHDRTHGLVSCRRTSGAPVEEWADRMSLTAFPGLLQGLGSRQGHVLSHSPGQGAIAEGQVPAFHLLRRQMVDESVAPFREEGFDVSLLDSEPDRL